MTPETSYGDTITSFASQPFNIFTGSVSTKNAGSHGVAYGNLYMSGYGGVVFAYNDSTGALEWTYGNGGEGNSTVPILGNLGDISRVFIAAIADGKLFTFSDEHSPTTPLYKASKYGAVNATTGQEIWTLQCLGRWRWQFVASWWSYCRWRMGIRRTSTMMQIYAIGQGPTAITATAPNTASAFGIPIVIRGTVTDISAGTQQEQQKANFPNGVPAISDVSQGDWMAHVYMQKPLPTNTTGVPVQLYVLDSNGNYRQIGTATTDSSGMYSYTWTPDIAGSYKVYAQFAGSNSYYPSSTETSFAVTEAPPPSTPAPTAAPSNTDTYVVGTGIAIIAAIAIVGAILALMLRKRP